MFNVCDMYSTSESCEIRATLSVVRFGAVASVSRYKSVDEEHCWTYLNFYSTANISADSLIWGAKKY